ncbi:cytochrome P450 [Lentzea guizhouensis]|uniref:cytochrome P450 n=1 Tax=Lentzea guizhouensis TaxID=1586287 RepID=UPI000ACBBC58|nr:cytochrome P450 [Lentzea guizhouensis]
MTTQNAVISSCPVHRAGSDDLVDLVGPTLYAGDDTYAVWQRMRDHDGLLWHQVDERRGFWSVARFADVDLVLSDYSLFTSERGTLLNLLGTDDPAGGTQLAVTDPPRHTEMQGRLKKALAVKAVERQRDMIRGKVLGLLEPLADGGVFDFAQAMLMLPIAVIGTMMDLPKDDWEWLTRMNIACVAYDDPDFQDPADPSMTLTLAHQELLGYFQDLVRHRRDHLGDDLVSVLISTPFEGRTMSLGEILSNCYSVLLGALVTTPHSPNYMMAQQIGTGVIEEWAAHPEVGPTAVEEALRLASPVHHFLRYATKDVEVAGTKIAAGDPVVAWLGAANRDEREFPDASKFDLRRKPNRHLAFGAGPHYCIGHSVARVTLRVLFEELFQRYENFSPAGTPERLISNFACGYKRVPITASVRTRPGA